MTTNRSLFRRMIDGLVAARTREANRRIAMYTATFTPEDMWGDLERGRDADRRLSRIQSGSPRMLMRAGG